MFLNGGLVGRLSKDRRGGLSFAYDPAHLDREDAVPVSLSLPLDDRTYAGDRVSAVFENLLPDLPTIRDAMAARLHAEGSDVHSLLAAAGADCVGALQFLPEGHAPGPVGASDGREIDEAGIAARLRSLGRFPLGLGADDDDGGFRISIAGAQEKTALLRRDGRWFVPAGTAATTHILKPAIGRRAGLDLSLSVQNEWFCLAVLRALGLPAANAEVHAFEDETALVVERFDRRWASGGAGGRCLLRVPQEDMLQALGVPTARKYEADGGPGIAEICALLGSADDPRRDRMVFLRAKVAYWLLAATDGHAKNFSIFLGAAGRFALAPLYDVMSVQPNLDAGEIARNKAQLAMAIGGGRHRRIGIVQARHFAQSARAFGLPPAEVEAALGEVGAALPRALERVVEGLPQGFPAPLVEAIVGGALKRLAAAEAADPAD